METGWGDWTATQQRVGARLAEDLRRDLEELRVQIRFGTAKLLNPNEVEISGPDGARNRVSGKNIIIATGSRPAFQGTENSKVINSDQMLKNVAVPEHLLIIGGSYIGCEFASIYRTLGARVTLVEEKENLLPSWDALAGEQIRHTLETQGVSVKLNEKIDLHSPEAGTERGVLKLKDGTVVSPGLTLIATGRKPNVEELGLESVDIAADKFISVNEKMQTAHSNIFAIGDANGLALLDSVAFAQARVAIATILGEEARFDLRWVPRCVYTDPLFASAGWTEKEAVAAGHNVEVLAETVRIVTDDDRSVVNPEPINIRLVVQPETRRLLGCQVVGAKAAEIVNLAATAIRSGLSVTQLADLAMIHPSASEALVRSLQRRFDRRAL
jgi:dihydrolipoamide dehydrogenase